jgi:hypothetical protein
MIPYKDLKSQPKRNFLDEPISEASQQPTMLAAAHPWEQPILWATAHKKAFPKVSVAAANTVGSSSL